MTGQLCTKGTHTLQQRCWFNGHDRLRVRLRLALCRFRTTSLWIVRCCCVWSDAPAGLQWLLGLAPLTTRALAFDKPLTASLDGFALHSARRSARHRETR